MQIQKENHFYQMIIIYCMSSLVVRRFSFEYRGGVCKARLVTVQTDVLYIYLLIMYTLSLNLYKEMESELMILLFRENLP